jgi:phosphoribosylaminoimidazolecarboxamide formyltransferase/IMP cyclohydrolase
MSSINRALISVSDKTGLAELARGLSALGIEILATGGTATALEAVGLKVVRSETLTGFNELLDGRVKTLHPAIHAGILARRDDPKHLEQLKAAGFWPIGLVIVNLYPFESTVARPGVTVEEAVEQIDIGGVALLRSAAKNHEGVAVIADPADYGMVLAELKESSKSLSLATRRKLAQKAFEHTASYDAAIARFMDSNFHGPDEHGGFPEKLLLSFRRKAVLRYGENPHQAAAIYTEGRPQSGSLAGAEQLNGKELSHNNYLDFDSALSLVVEFTEPCCAVIKHRNACGCAAGSSLGKAIEAAVMADPLSAFGGIVAINHIVDDEAAAVIMKVLKDVRKFDGIAAPDYSGNALAMLKEKKNMVILKTGPLTGHPPHHVTVRSISGGLLAQEPDTRQLRRDELRVVTKRDPGPEEINDLLFAWKVAKHIVSNAIVFAKNRCTVGIGSGQVNRVGSVIIAARQAGAKAQGAVLASDAFFPYPDGMEEAGRAGITAAIQPGGSVKDEEVIKAADAAGMAMVLTGIRHFKH